MLGHAPHTPRDGTGGGEGKDEGTVPGCVTVASAAAAAVQLPQPPFRYWVDEILWSQGRVATVTIEEVLDQMGGQRTGGPHKAVQKLPTASSDASTQQLLQHMRLSSEQQQQQQLRRQPGVLSGAQAAVTGVTTAGMSPSSSEGTMHSSRTSSASSLDAALNAATAVGSGSVGPAAAGAVGNTAGNTAVPVAGPAAGAGDSRPLQPCNSAALNGSSGSGGSSSGSRPATAAEAADAAAAIAAAAAGDSSSWGSEDPGAGAAGQLGPTKRPDDHLLGYHHVKQWDLLWTKSVYAIRAARQLQQGQVVSAIAGLNCLSMKKRMVQTLRMALGTQAFQIVPLSFCMPEDLPAWQAWLSSPQGAACDTGLWMLKTGQDAGKGLKLVRTQQALQVAVRPPKNPSKPQTHIKVAQQYLTNPLLLQGRKFHLRLWLLVTGHAPLRAYLHCQGLVLFSSEPYDNRRPLDGPGVRPSASHVTNYARNEDSWVWDLPQLQQVLGHDKWQQLWQQMKQASALTAAAVLGPLRAAHRWLQPSVANYGFQMLGLDYLIDESLHPWLLEVNSAPSIMAVHSDPGVRGLIKSTKQAMLRDMLAMVQHRMLGSSGGYSGSSGGSSGSSRPSALSWQEELAAEMANRGGFEPVMHLFPVRPGGSSSSGGSSAVGGDSSSSSSRVNIPWQDVDLQLQQVLRQQYSY